MQRSERTSKDHAGELVLVVAETVVVPVVVDLDLVALAKGMSAQAV